MSAPRIQAALGDGIAALGLGRCPAREQALLQYLDLIVRWNRVYNLTAVTDVEAMVSRHLLDSLAVISHLRGRSFADIGSGAGLPGVPLAIWLPDSRFALVESSGRKARFLRQVKIELRLSNVEVIEARVQNWQPLRPPEGILSRAFSSLPQFLGAAAHLAGSHTVFYALKGRWPESADERRVAAHRILAVHALQIPGESAPRHLVEATLLGESAA